MCQMLRKHRSPDQKKKRQGKRDVEDERGGSGPVHGTWKTPEADNALPYLAGLNKKGAEKATEDKTG